MLDRRAFIRGLGATVVGGVAAVTYGSFLTRAAAATNLSGTISGTSNSYDDVTVPAGSTLKFNPDANTTLKVSGDMTVLGTLMMKPASKSVVHILQFTGGGELMVTGSGKLNLVGSTRTAWNRTGDDSTWSSSDRLVVTPIKSGDYTVRSFTKGSTVPSISSPYGTFKSEVLNLTRNVRIEGTSSTPMARIMIHENTAVHTIKYAAIRYAGVSDETSFYPLHFHMNGNGCRGTVLKGVVVEDALHHAFVVHATNGVTLQDCVAYKVIDDAFWWDPPEDRETTNNSDDVIYDQCVAAKVEPGSTTPPPELTAFLLGGGVGCAAKGCVATAVAGGTNSSGFHWPSRAIGPENIWVFEDCIAHNNRTHGIFIWQNTATTPHFIDRFVGFHNGVAGQSHGAYSLKGYHTRWSTYFDNGETGLRHLAQTTVPAHRQTEERLSYEACTFGGDPAVILGLHNAAGTQATLYLSSTFDGPVRVDDDGLDRGLYDFVDCGLEPSDFEIASFHASSLIRVQRADGSAYKITPDGNVTSITAFYDGWSTLAPVPGTEFSDWEAGCGNQ